MGVPVPVPFYVKAALFVKAFLAANWFKIALVAGQYAYQRHQRKKLEKLANQGLAASYSGSVDYSSIVFGERMLEHGTRVWSNSGPDSRYVVEVIALMNQGRGGIEGITKVFLDEEEYAFPDDFEQLPRTGRPGQTQNWWRPKQVNSTANGNRWNKDDNFLFRFHLGDQTRADEALVVGNDTGNAAYSATRIGKGIVYVIPAYRNNVNVLGHGIPDTRWQIKGYKCYDPRVAGASFSETNKWIWSDNPVVQAAFVQTEFINGGSDERVDWDRVREFAEYCDEEVEFNPYSDDENHRHEGVHVISQIPTEDGASYNATPSIVSGSRMRDPDQTGAGAQTRYIDDRLASFTPAPGDGDLEDDWLSDGTGEIVKVTLMAESLDMTLVLTTDKLTSDKLGYMRLKFERTIGSPSQDYTIDVPILSWGDPVESTDNGGPAGAERTIYTYTPKHKEIIQQRNLLGNYRALDNEFFHDMVRTNPAKVKVTLYVPSPSALEKRYRSDIVLPGNSSPADFFEQLALSCDGNYLRYQDNGKWALEPSSPGSSTLEIKEANLGQYPAFVSHDELSERFTEIAGAYVDRKKGWKRTETPPLKSPSLRQRERTDLPRQEVAYDAVVRFSQVWRLLYRQAARQEMQETISLGMYWDGLELIYGTRFDFKSEMLSIDALKKFRVERVSLTSEDVPIVVEAREDADWIYDPVGWEEYPYYTEDDALVVPYREGPPLGSLTATGIVEAIKLDWTSPAFGEIGNVEIYDSDTASWNHESRRLAAVSGLGATSLTIPYDPGTRKYFWAINVVGRESSARFPNDDVTTVTAVAQRHQVVVSVPEGECPPEDLWEPGKVLVDRNTNQTWYGGFDPWGTSVPFDAAVNGSVLTYDGTSTLDLSDPIVWTPKNEPGSPDALTSPEGIIYTGLQRPLSLSDALLAVRGEANIEEDRKGVLFVLPVAGRVSTGNNLNIFPPEPLRVPDSIFESGTTNAEFRQVRLRGRIYASSNLEFRFADDTRAGLAVGPNFAKMPSKYTFVIRVGTGYYPVAMTDADITEPYTVEATTGAYTQSLFDAMRSTTDPADFSLALVDEDEWEDGSNWRLAFEKATRRETVTFVTAYAGNDRDSPYEWEREGTPPVFIGTARVLELRQSERCWMPDLLSNWLRVQPPRIPDLPRPAGGPVLQRFVPETDVGNRNGTGADRVIKTPSRLETNRARIKTHNKITGDGSSAPNERSVEALSYIWRLWFSLDDDEDGTWLEYFTDDITPEQAVTLWWDEFPESWINATLEPRETVEEIAQDGSNPETHTPPNKALIIPATNRNWIGVDVVEPGESFGKILKGARYDLSTLLQGVSRSGILNIQFSPAKNGQDGRDGIDGDARINDNDFVITRPPPE